MLHIGSPEALVAAVAQLMPHNRGPVPSIRHFSLFDLEEPRLALVEASLVRTILLRNDAITKSASCSILKREDAEAWPFAAMLKQNPWSTTVFCLYRAEIGLGGEGGASWAIPRALAIELLTSPGNPWS